MIVRAQVLMGADSSLPRDRFIITPHFEVSQVEGPIDAPALATDLATAITTWSSVAGANREVRVKISDAQGTKPVFPIADVTQNPGLVPVSQQPRELALCLSFYSGQNRPRQRGRLYVPAAIAAGASQVTARPSSAMRDKVAALVPIFAALGGINVDWVVYSRADNVARKVSNWWVDDEWDVIRRRGLRSSTRTVGTTSG